MAKYIAMVGFMFFSLGCGGGGSGGDSSSLGLILALGGVSTSSNASSSQAQYSLVYNYNTVTVGTSFTLKINVYTAGQNVEEEVYLSSDSTISEQDTFLQKITIDGSKTGEQSFSITIPCGTSTSSYYYGYIGLKKKNASNSATVYAASSSSCDYVAFSTTVTTTTAGVGGTVNFNATVSSGKNSVTADVYIQNQYTSSAYTSTYRKAGSVTIQPSPSSQSFSVTIPSDSSLIAPTAAKVALYINQTGNSVMSGNTFSYTNTPPVNVSPSGTLSYQYFPIGTNNRIDYTSGSVLPARGITVQLLDSLDTVLSSSKTNNSGAYSFSSVSVSGSFKIRMVAELKSTSSPIMDITVRNATAGTTVGSIYTVSSSSVTASTCTSSCTVNVTATHPTFNTTASSNASGPFAILDVVKRGVDKVLTVDGSTTFPTLSIKTNDSTDGSYFTQSSSTCGTGVPNCIVLLGNEFSDPDHFDTAVIAHEFTHYLEGALSRSDSIGGSHSTNDYLEPRVAYGEGLGNAMGGIINDSKDYRDSTYSGGFSFDLETGTHTTKGFYSESSVQSVIWDLYDSVSDSKNSQTDNLSMTFAQIWAAVTSLKNVDSITHFHEFAKSLKSANSGSSSAITAIMAMESIATDEASETNVASVASAGGAASHTCTGGSSGYAYTPLILSVTADTGDLTGLNSSQFCGLTSYANNKLFGSRFYKITPAISGTLSVAVTDGQTDQESIVVFLTRRGVSVSGSDTSIPSASAGTITRNFSVTSGNIYILEIRTYNRCIQGLQSTGCYGNSGIGEYSVNINLP